MRPKPASSRNGAINTGIQHQDTQINDYVESINQYTAGKFDGVTVTNMGFADGPAAGGVDTSAIVLGDFSNGNDGIVLKNGKGLADIRSQINIVELSVSHYLLARALATVKLRERDIKIINTSDADIVGAFKSARFDRGVTWNPQLMEVRRSQTRPRCSTRARFRRDPGPAGDQDRDAKDNPDLGKALVGIWYETIALMEDPARRAKPRAPRWQSSPAPICPASMPSSRPPRCSTRPRTRSRS